MASAKGHPFLILRCVNLTLYEKAILTPLCTPGRVDNGLTCWYHLMTSNQHKRMNKFWISVKMHNVPHHWGYPLRINSWCTGFGLETHALKPRNWRNRTVGIMNIIVSLQWRYNEHDCVSNHQHMDCLLNVFSCADQSKHKRSTSLAFVRGIRRGPVNSPH